MIFAIAAALSVVLAGSNVVHATSHVALYSIKAKGSDLLWRILRDGRWGYMDRTGKIVIKPRFVRASDFFGGIASVCVNQDCVSQGGVSGWRALRLYRSVWRVRYPASLQVGPRLQR
jgi:hypothetical protein